MANEGVHVPTGLETWEGGGQVNSQGDWVGTEEGAGWPRVGRVSAGSQRAGGVSLEERPRGRGQQRPSLLQGQDGTEREGALDLGDRATGGTGARQARAQGTMEGRSAG